MYPHQAERLSEALEAAQLDALVATSPENVAYIAGYRNAGGRAVESPEFGVFTRAGTALVVPAAETASATTDGVDVDHIVCFGEWRAWSSEAPNPEARRLEAVMARATSGPAEALAAALDRLGVRHGSIGVDERRLTPGAWEALTTRLSGFKVTPAAGHLAYARRVKGPYEIECLGHSLRIAEEALDEVIQAIERGMTEREAANLFTSGVLKRGGWPRPPVVTIGERSAIPASSPTDRALRPGDLVRFDVGCTFKGYWSSVGRTAVLGEPSARHEALYGAVQGGLEAAIAAGGSGVPVGRVFQAAVEAIKGNGVPGHEAGHAGHGIGLELFEPPMITPGSGAVLALGEVLCLEAAHYQIGTMGASVRNTVLITTAGARVLNRSHHGLVVLD